jgi:hypothetical protein
MNYLTGGGLQTLRPHEFHHKLITHNHDIYGYLSLEGTTVILGVDTRSYLRSYIQTDASENIHIYGLYEDKDCLIQVFKEDGTEKHFIFEDDHQCTLMAEVEEGQMTRMSVIGEDNYSAIWETFGSVEAYAKAAATMIAKRLRLYNYHLVVLEPLMRYED